MCMYVGGYNNNVNCRWQLEVPEGYIIRLYVNDFRLEDGGPDCSYDYVEIYDSDSSLIGRYINLIIKVQRTESILIIPRPVQY